MLGCYSYADTKHLSWSWRCRARHYCWPYCWVVQGQLSEYTLTRWKFLLEKHNKYQTRDKDVTPQPHKISHLRDTGHPSW